MYMHMYMYMSAKQAFLEGFAFGGLILRQCLI